MKAARSRKSSHLRRRILGFVLGLIALSILGTALSLVRITEVSRLLDGINRVSIPLGRSLIQLEADSEIFERELTRGMVPPDRLAEKLNDPRWRPRSLPKWMTDVIQGELVKLDEILKAPFDWGSDPGTKFKQQWIEWSTQLTAEFQSLKVETETLQSHLEARRLTEAQKLYPTWSGHLTAWIRSLQWGVAEHDLSLRRMFGVADGRVAELRTGLELILSVVVGLSLLMLWLGERALRPLGELTRLAREIARRGLKREDKDALPKLFAGRKSDDEINQLSREFHHMATALLEREKVVEAQNRKLEEQNKLLERLRAAENLAMVGRMSAQVAHEIRNPLHSLGLEAELGLELLGQLEKAHPASRESRELRGSLRSVLEAVDRLERITQNYLKLSKLSSGEKTSVNLAEVLEGVLAIYTTQCEALRIRVEWRFDEAREPLVSGDRGLLEQTFGNLMQNAIQAVEAQSGDGPRTITWRIAQDNAWVTVDVQDSGDGIPETVRAKLFTPFVTSKAQGTGLGLAFVRQVVEDHGASVRALDAKRGAHFRLRFPREVKAAQPAEVSPA